MGLIYVSVAAATAVVDYDLLKDSELQEVEYARSIVGIGLKGSAAAGDSKVEIMVGDKSIGHLYNSATGFIAGRNDIIDTMSNIPSGTKIRGIVRDAPATNPLNLLIVTAE